jgi:hypothetical protein
MRNPTKDFGIGRAFREPLKFSKKRKRDARQVARRMAYICVVYGVALVLNEYRPALGLSATFWCCG